jgi:ABC-2 type transport system ATP-binding protein
MDHMVAIKATGLTKYYGDFLAVDHINFEVQGGEIFGFLGPNGAGKTTTIRMLTGILEPSKGKIEILGYDMKRERIKARERMGIVPEMANPYIDLTAMQNLKLIGRLYGMKKSEIKERGEELLKLFQLYEKKDKKVRGFSKGMKQRLSLAMAMLPDPELLFLDEPTSGLDVMSARLIKKIIRNENKRGKTIFMSTHNMQDANELCSRIAIINHGKLIAIDTPENIKRIGEKHKIVEASFLPFKFNPEVFEERVEVLGDKVRFHTEDVDTTVKKIVDYAEKNSLKIVTLNVETPSLEDVFLALVGGKNE